MRERDIKKHLVQRVKALGGEARKVRWEGRRGAPDWIVMLPGFKRFNVEWPGRTIWAELKRPGALATFPANELERAQAREHTRMRKMGQRVVVIDSIEGVEELLR